MNLYINNNVLHIVFLDTPCCSLFSDNIWYRCLIKEVIKTRNPNKILVHLWYVDYGNNEQRIVTLEK